MIIGLGIGCFVLIVICVWLYIKYTDTKINLATLNERIISKININSELELTNKELNQNKDFLLQEITKYKSIISSLQTKLDEKTNFYQNNQARLKSEFENIATAILDKNSKKFSEHTKQNLGTILDPMKVQLNDFKKKVEDIYEKETKDRDLLRFELKSLKELNQKISTDAINLTNALKGQSKTQGSWGEMVLERVLENSGLRKGKEYLREEFLKHSDGKGYKPDVIVNLPNNRQVIIDAKTSLSAYEQYISQEDENQKKSLLKAHIISVNNHINELSSKRYEELDGVNTLDFIFMFVPIESALMLALENDSELFDKAFGKKIVLVSPATLLVALRAVENSWRYEKQAQSTVEVIRLAQKLYAKVKAFVDDFEKIRRYIDMAQKSYDEAHNKLCSGRDNIIRQIEVFKDKSNINPAKQIPQELVDKAMVE